MWVSSCPSNTPKLSAIIHVALQIAPMFDCLIAGGNSQIDWHRLNERHRPFRAWNRIRFEVLVQVALLGKPLVTGKRSGSSRTKQFALHLPPDTVALTATYVSVVVKMPADVADRSILLRPFPTAHLAWPHRGNTPELPITKVLEEWSEVVLYLFLRIPSVLECPLDVLPLVKSVPPSEFVGRYAHGN